MFAPLTIAVDAMGGDYAPRIVIGGAALARERHPGVRFHFFGDQSRIAPLLSLHSELEGVSQITHTDKAISSGEKPAVALRTGRQSSMRLAIDAVHRGEADCIVSAGNTGALMGMAKYVLRTLPGIDRPAIATFFPTMEGESVMLDMGANVECTPDNLVQFAIMGSLFSQTVLGIRKPTVGLLNIGAEQVKGKELVRSAAALLEEAPLPGTFEGFIEGNDIPMGKVDVVVTDGFTGNVALKTAEGTSKFITEMMKRSVKSSLLAKVGFLLASGALRKFKTRVDPRRYNGAMFLGLAGVCVKSHGGTDELGFANAIDVGIDIVSNGFNNHIAQELQRLHEVPEDGAVDPAVLLA